MLLVKILSISNMTARDKNFADKFIQEGEANTNLELVPEHAQHKPFVI